MGKSAPRYYEGEPGQILARVWFHIKRKSRKAYSRRIRKLIARHIRSSKSIADLSPRGRLLLRYLVNVTKDYCLVPLKAHSALPAKAIRLRDGEKFVSAAP